PVILDDQRNRWRRGEPATVEDYLARFPTLGDDPEGLLDLIYNEVVLREERGQAASLGEYQARFPDLAAPLRDLFEIHGAIDNVSHQSTILDSEDEGSEVATVLPIEESSSIEAVILEPADFTAESVALGSSEPPPLPIPLPTSAKEWPILDGYDIVDVLGRGGMGVVYRARDRNRGVDVAVKTMQRVDPGAIYRFKQEFRTLLDVSHPNLITLYELISDGRSWFIVMELLDAVDFLEYVRRGSRPMGQLALAARPNASDRSKGLGTD
ncbi:protein kinase domain-containing protein, partial [Singulisphaera rosea]